MSVAEVTLAHPAAAAQPLVAAVKGHGDNFLPPFATSYATSATATDATEAADTSSHSLSLTASAYSTPHSPFAELADFVLPHHQSDEKQTASVDTDADTASIVESEKSATAPPAETTREATDKEGASQECGNDQTADDTAGEQAETPTKSKPKMDRQETDAESTVAITADDGSASQLSVEDDAKSVSVASSDGGDDESVVDYNEFFVGSSSIADPLKYIAMSFEDKCRELKTLTKTHEKETVASAALIATLTEEKEQLQEALSESLSTRAHLEEQLEQMASELAALREDVSHKDQLLATSDKISTSLFGVLMAAKETLDSAGSLAPAMRSMSSAYAGSASATEDETDEDLSEDDEDEDDAQTADTDHEGADDNKSEVGNTTLKKPQAAAAPPSPQHAAV